jgi:hypothetical protein
MAGFQSAIMKTRNIKIDNKSTPLISILIKMEREKSNGVRRRPFRPHKVLKKNPNIPDFSPSP